jgi:flagellar biosynthetic protein FlhB
MADSSNKTEKPTPRRLQKAREEGQFASSKDFVGGLQFVVFVALIGAFAAQWLSDAEELTRFLIRESFRESFRPEDLSRYATLGVRTVLLPLGAGGALILLATLAVQLGITRFGVSLKPLQPSLERLNPIKKIKDLPGRTVPATIQAVFMLVVFGGAIFLLLKNSMADLIVLPLSHLDSGLAAGAETLQDLLWKAAGIFVVFGTVDLFRQHRRYTKKLRMSRQDIKDEIKESEGDVHVKARARRMRRDMLRRQMMNDVPQATAVVVNPTHYAVAIKYNHGSMMVPMVVAKGRDYLAQRIREIATEHNVPIVENPPLARALHKSVEVGQEIPPNLYRAVAEILAYIYRLTKG